MRCRRKRRKNGDGVPYFCFSLGMNAGDDDP